MNRVADLNCVVDWHPLRSSWIAVLTWLAVALIATRSAALDARGPRPPLAAGPDSPVAVPKASPRSETRDPSNSAAPTRLREGWRISDQVGEFQKTDDGINFYSADGKRVLHVLENLALERITRLLEDDASPRQWSVSGVVTEFNGQNFLLITKAIIKPRSSLAAPSRIPTAIPTGDREGVETRPPAAGRSAP